MTFSKTVELPLTLGNLSEGQFSFPSTLPNILALDPGGSTGWAWFDPTHKVINCGQIIHVHHRVLYDFIGSIFQRSYYSIDPSILDQPLEIISESFQFRQFSGFDKSKVELDSVEYIGVTKLYSQLTDVPLYFQTASVAKHFVSDDKLRKLGWYSRTAGMVHARDALRHLLYRLVVVHKIREPFTNQWLNKIGSEKS